MASYQTLKFAKVLSLRSLSLEVLVHVVWTRLGVSLGLEHVKQQQQLLTGNCRGDASKRATLASSPVGINAEISTLEPSTIGDDSDSSADRETRYGTLRQCKH